MMKITWDNYFISLLDVIRQKSPDPNTKCSCVLVNQFNEIVATGYNGPVRNSNDELVPLERPTKYTWMIHAEHNAILSAARQGKSTTGCSAYISGAPCINCLQYLLQAGVTKIKWTKISVPQMVVLDENYFNNVELLKKMRPDMELQEI